MVGVIIKGVVGKERFLILDAKGSAATRRAIACRVEDRNSANLNILQTNIF